MRGRERRASLVILSFQEHSLRSVRVNHGHWLPGAPGRRRDYPPLRLAPRLLLPQSRSAYGSAVTVNQKRLEMSSGCKAAGGLGSGAKRKHDDNAAENSAAQQGRYVDHPSCSAACCPRQLCGGGRRQEEGSGSVL
eukprot:3698626-Prymnesium_polylepis.1